MTKTQTVDKIKTTVIFHTAGCIGAGGRVYEDKQRQTHLRPAQGKRETKRTGDAFHALHGGGEEGLLVHAADSEHTGIAQAVQLFGFCERSFNGFPAPGADAFAAVCLRKRVRLLQCILPYEK